MKYYIYDGTPTKGKAGKNQQAKFEADNDHLAGCEVSKAEYDAAIKAEAEEHGRRKRRASIADMIGTIADVLIANEGNLDIPAELAADWQKLKDLAQ